VAGRSADELTVVGAGGEIYRRSAGTTTWKRAKGGGTAATLVAARGATSTEIWALGATTPPYRYDGTTWSAPSFPMSGAGVMGHSGAISVNVARRVMVWSGGKWVQLPSHGLLGVSAVWASGPKDAIVATGAGELKRFDGATWKVIAPVFPTADERVLQLHGTGGAVVAAIGDKGSLMLVDKTTAKLATMESPLGAFQGRAGATGTKLHLVGAAKVGQQDRNVIVKLDGTKLLLVDTLPVLTAGDELAAMVVATDGAVGLVTRRGTIHFRGADGVWTKGTVDPALPVEDHGTNPPAKVAPVVR
jgi:hypothetical protein